MLAKSIYFTILATIFSILFAVGGSFFIESREITVILYALGVAVAVILFKGWPPKTEKAQVSWLNSCLLPIIYISAVYLIGMLFVQINPPNFSTLTVLPFIFIASLLEEIGWRGYLFDLLKKFSWIKMNLIIGLLWAIWHYPAIFTGSYNLPTPLIIGTAIFTINVILLSFIFGWMRQKTGGVIAPTLLHTFHNATYLFWASSNESIIQLGEGGLFLTGSLIIIILFLQAWKKCESSTH